MPDLQIVIDDRTKVLAAFGVAEDRLNAAKNISDYWHNRRKKYNQEQEALAALAQDGKQIGVFEVTYIVLLCRWLLE